MGTEDLSRIKSPPPSWPGWVRLNSTQFFSPQEMLTNLDSVWRSVADPNLFFADPNPILVLSRLDLVVINQNIVYCSPEKLIFIVPFHFSVPKHASPTHNVILQVSFSVLGTRQHCRDNLLTIFSGQKIVDFCIMSIFVVGGHSI